MIGVQWDYKVKFLREEDENEYCSVNYMTPSSKHRYKKKKY